MRGYEFLDKLGWIDADLIEEASKKPKRHVIAGVGIVAACLCFVLTGMFVTIRHRKQEHTIQHWAASFSAADYFKYNDTGISVTNSEDEMSEQNADYDPPYDETRFFSGERKNLEKEQVIPVMEQYPEFTCSANYFSDGSFYSLIVTWDRRGDGEYGSLSVTAGYQELEMPVCDQIEIEVDENGNIIEPAITVTERQGVQIVARGNENRKKTLTFENNYGWYQIEGSWNNSYSDMVALLDWFWEHPIDFERFPMEQGDHYTYEPFSDDSDIFSAYLPDIKTLGYQVEQEMIWLKNGKPCSFDGYYMSDSMPGFSWHIDTEPDYYERQEVLGDFESLTVESITDAMEEECNCVRFTRDGYVISVYINSGGTPEILWEIIAAS